MVLRPILEYGTIAPVGDQFVGELSDIGVKVVLNHQHYCGSVATLGWVSVQWMSPHIVFSRAKSVHVDAPMGAQLISELWCKKFVHGWGEVAQCIV